MKRILLTFGLAISLFGISQAQPVVGSVKTEQYQADFEKKQSIAVVSDYDDTIIYGDFGKNFNSHNFKHDDIKKFDQIFYEQANVPYEYRWKKFKINRDFELENKIYEDLVKNENYCFIHEDKQRNYVIDKEFISKNLIHININNIKKEDLYFITDYYKIIKNCKEIHCIDSSFSCFIDNVDDFKNIPKYLHRYTRNVPNNPKYINNWNIIYENNIFRRHTWSRNMERHYC